MATIDTYKRNSLLSAKSEIILKDNCPVFSEGIAHNLELNLIYQSSTVLTALSNFKKVELVYIFENEEGIKNYLNKNKELIDLLLEAHIQIECRFGDAPLYLQLHTDFENSEWTKLFLVIKNNLHNDEARNKLEDLLRVWFFKKDKQVRKLLSISEESQ